MTPTPGWPSPALPRRDDIDGLRGLAVAAVVVFHAFPGVLPGGFTGVDVFFVVSGFLITSIVEADLDGGRFSFRDFWARRIRRLFPALLLVLVAALAVGWALLDPEELAQLSRSVAAGAAFASNLLLASQVGYFDESATAKPLLHLWSLAIEEQFYLAWPVLLWLLRRLRLGRVGALAVLVAASFAWNLRATGSGREVAFYSTLARAWELGLGGLLAVLVPPSSDRAPSTGSVAPVLRDAASVAGLALVLAGLLVADAKRAYPGTVGLLPTIGTALLLAAGEDAFANRLLLRHPAAVALGLVSYPLYLWHWPPLSFATILAGRTPPVGLRVAIVAGALAAAWATWRGVETPVRRSSRPGAVAGVLLAAMAAIGLAASLVSPEVAARLHSGPVARHGGDLGDAPFRKRILAYPGCPDDLVADDGTRCQWTHGKGPPTIAVVGDSHAGHLFPGLAEALPERSIAYYWKSGVPFASNPEFDAIFRRIEREPSIRTVVLASWWASPARQSPRGERPADAIRRTVQRLTGAGKNVVVAADTPAFEGTPRPCKYTGTAESCGFDERLARGRIFMSNTIGSVVKDDPHAGWVDLTLPFRDGDRFTMVVDGRVVYRDGDHVNIDGSRLIGAAVAREILALEARAPGGDAGRRP